MAHSASFFEHLPHFASNIAALEGQTQISFAELAGQTTQFRQQLAQPSSPERQLVFLKAHNNIATLLAYLACLQAQHPIMLLDPAISLDKLQSLTKQYQPNVLIDNGSIERLHANKLSLSPHLAVLLSTSGSTGSAKQVCLSRENLQENAQSIATYLPIWPSDRTITTLPFFYSYGLSVINSHLLRGACIVFNQDTMMSREFWHTFKQQKITSFAGVPYHYEMLIRLRFDNMDLPCLRYFTQAGGKLNEAHVGLLAQYAETHNKAFFTMYGQTEATARMAYLSPERVAKKPYAIGRAIPGGQFYLRDENSALITKPRQSGELIYCGGNIMLGYANGQQDLVHFDPLPELATGDLAYQDEEGDFVITGRLKRFIKLFGQRLNLDEIECLLNQKGFESYCVGDDSKLLVAIKNEVDLQQLKMSLSRDIRVNHTAINIVKVKDLPLTANGKKDYPALMQMLGA
jgi:long-chain acyl-CoA synthetase